MAGQLPEYWGKLGFLIEFEVFVDSAVQMDGERWNTKKRALDFDKPRSKGANGLIGYDHAPGNR